ncbi:armadillo repeat-containing protein 5-like [Anneissia japonica]|uniref:armadillo repeat-containing protein 5-like n=1 Tax=Anneissia japonica TaxID=1529436 RepID=UPI0014255BD2|nr:armadillo repeat-containing protein 5-like [Anneissia japonica]
MSAPLSASPTKMSKLCTLISSLNADVSNKDVLDSLKILKTDFVKRPNGCEQIVKCKGIPPLISLLEHTNSTRIMDLSLSILADCSLQLEEIRLLIKKLNGIKIIVNILKCQHKSVLNRAARALANLALSHENIATIHKCNSGPLLIKLLRESIDPGTQESLTRAIRLIANTPRHQALIVKAEGLRPIVKHLQSDLVSVISQCVRAVAAITSDCSPAAAIQVLEEGGITRLVQLTLHDKSTVKEHAFAALINLMKHSTVRASVGSVNGVALFLEGLQHPCEKAFALHLHALCLCCQEAVNRAKVKELNGLPVLINILKTNEHTIHHDRVILALECFYFDEDVLQLFAGSGLIQILIEKLLSSDMLQDVTRCTEDEVDILEGCEEKTESDSLYRGTNSNISSPHKNPKTSTSTFKVKSIFDVGDVDDDENDAADEGHDEDESRMSPKTDSSQSTLVISNDVCEFDQFKRKPQSYSPLGVDLAAFLRNQEQGHPSSMSPSSDICYSPCFSMSPPSYEFSPTWSPQMSPESEDRASSSGTFHSGVVEKWQHEDNFIKNLEDNNTEKGTSDILNIEKDPESSEEIALPPGSNKKRKHNYQMFGRKSRKHNVDDIKSSFTFWRVEQEEAKAMENLSHTSVETTHLPVNESSPAVIRLKGREHGILLLLSRFSHKNNLCKYLTTLDCFNVFLDIILKSKNMRSVAKCRRIVVRLLHNAHCLEDIILLGIPTLIKQRLIDNSSLKQELRSNVRKYWPAVEIIDHLLHHVALQAETVFGETLIENMITSTLKLRRFACCKALPFLCRSPKTQKKLLHDMSAMSLYREFLHLSQDEQTLKETVFSLQQLAHIVGIKDPVKLHRRKLGYQTLQGCCKYEESLVNTDFEFVLDDNTRLAANRKVVSQNSDFFAAMLSGDFKESHQTIVPLADASQKTLEFILHKLYGCTQCSVISLFAIPESGIQVEGSGNVSCSPNNMPSSEINLSKEEVPMSSDAQNTMTMCDTSPLFSGDHSGTGDLNERTANDQIGAVDIDDSNVLMCIEAMVVSDRFLLHNIQRHVYDRVVLKVLSGKTAPSLYTYSKQFEYEELSKACLAHVLCGDNVNSETFKAFLKPGTSSALDEMFSFIIQKSR